MPELFVFLIKVNISLALFCLAYYLVMRRLTYYKLNRAFLVGGILLSAIYPLLNLSNLFKETPKLVLDVQPQLPAAIHQTRSMTDFWSVLVICFWTGAVIMGLKMVIRLCSLFKIHRHSTPSKVNSHPVRLLQGSISTFSFWTNIYLNPEQHQKEEIAAILKHEQVHVKDFHTFDILLAELAIVFNWFNPGAWLMRKAIKENVEFITDEKTLEMGIDRKAYQYSMLHASTGLHCSELTTNFNITSTKRRIVMMNRKRTSSLYLLSYLLVIPAIVFAIAAFTVKKVEVSDRLARTNNNIKPHTVFPNGAERATSSDAIESNNFGVSTKDIETKSSNNKTSKVQVIEPRKASGIILSVEQRKVRPLHASSGNNIESTSADNNVSTKINIIRVGKTSNDSPVHSMGQPITFVNDKEVSPDEVKSIDAESIISMKVRKNQDSTKNAIYIYTK
jgi:hypothetical protein